MGVSAKLRKMATDLKRKKFAANWTKGHFEAVAQIIESLENRATKKDAAVQFAKLFLAENPNFRTKQFLTACGIANVAKVVEEIE